MVEIVPFLRNWFSDFLNKPYSGATLESLAKEYRILFNGYGRLWHIFTQISRRRNLVLIQPHDTGFNRHSHQISLPIDIELPHQVSAVGFYGPHADREMLGNSGVGLSLSN